MNKKSFLFIVSILLIYQYRVTAQYNPSWPDARTRAHLIYHPKSKALLLLDGYMVHLDSTQNNVWKWNGRTWKYVTAYGPGSRIVTASALNNKSGAIEVFGGWGRGIMNDKKSDVWKFDNDEWQIVSPGMIGSRDHHKMIYADHLDAFVVYGGFDLNLQFDTVTWILKNGIFNALPIAGPGGRANFGFSYDPDRKKIVLFGGKNATEPADLWEFDGKKWEKIPVRDIGVTTIHSAVYDKARKMVIVHNVMGETWGWDGKEFTKIATGGPNGSGVALGYDAGRKVIAAYGGFGPYGTSRSSLWELKGSQWKKISDNGTWLQINRDQSVRMGDHATIIFNQVNELVSEKKITEAEDVLQKEIDSKNMAGILYVQLAEIKYSLKKYEEGIAAYEELLEMENVYPRGTYFYHLARGYVKINDHDKAFNALTKAVENGFGSKRRFENDPDLASLKSDTRFQELLKKFK